MNPFIPSIIHPILRHCKGSKAMFEILNKTNDIPTGQVTWNKTYISFKSGVWLLIAPVSVHCFSITFMKL